MRAIVLILFLSNTNSFAQSVIIGNGLATNATTSASPVNIWYRKTVSHFVITAAEINSAGYTGAGNINKIGWFVVQSPSYDIPGYTIQMKHTTAANASTVTNGGWINAKSSFTYSPQDNSWDLITLDSPFNWDGNQNIAIRLCWSQVTPTYDASGQCLVTTENNGYKYQWNDSAGDACGLNPSTYLNYKPQVNFIFDTLTVWTGNQNSDWFTSNNWTAGVPTEKMDVLIPNGTPNSPNLNGVASCKNITLNGTLTNTNGEIFVYGDFNNTNTWIDINGTIIMSGENSSTINTTQMSTSELHINNKGGTSITGNTINITGELKVDKSTLTTNDLLTLKSTALGTARIDELNPPCTYTLNMQDSWGDGWNGGYLTLLEDGNPVDVFAASGTGSSENFVVSQGTELTLNYTSGSWENENTYDLIDSYGISIFNDGTNPSTGDVFITTATCDFTPMIFGEITVERYIDAGETYWRYMGSAVQGADIGQFNDDFVTAGYPGSWFPNFGWVSAYNYDETLGAGLGYLECTGATQVIGVGEGWQVWCGDTITGTQPFTFDLKGVPNQGDIDFPVTYTNTGTVTEDGFNLISNPYASTIDWDDTEWTKTNMANATYIQNPDNQQYATYVAGASTNGGSRYIASQQSFWVQSTSASPVLTAREGVKSSVDQGFFKNGNLSPGITISLQGNGEFDEVVIRHIPGANDDFEYDYDANKWWGGWGEYPQLSSINNQNKDLTVHSFDTNYQEWSIPLRAVVFQNGMYNLSFTNVSEIDVPCLHLEDLYTGDIFLINEGSTFSFDMMDSTYSPRFVLHVGKNYNSNTFSASCNGNSDGQFEIDLNSNIAFDYEIWQNGTNEYGNSLGNPLTISNLSAGVYNLQIPSLINSCNVTDFNFVINEPSPILSNEIISYESFGSDGSIVLNTSGGVPPYTYLWSSGEIDNSLTDLSGGQYSVLIMDNDQCQIVDTFDVISMLSIDSNENSIQFNYVPIQNHIVITRSAPFITSFIGLYSSEGKKLKEYSVNENSLSQIIALPTNLAAGIYILSVGQNSFKFNTNH